MAQEKTVNWNGRVFMAAFVMQLMLVSVFCLNAFAAEVVRTGSAQGVVVDTQVGTPAAKAGPTATPEKPYTNASEYNPAKMMKHENINYVVKEESRVAGNSLVLACTTDQMADEAVLGRLAAKLYQDNNGQSYDKVTIFWYAGMNPVPAKPWARTDVDKVNARFAVVRMQ